MAKGTIIVAGALANKPHNGGEAWVRLSWVRGFQKLGFDVYFLEQIAAANCVDEAGSRANPGDSVNLKYFHETIQTFGLQDRSALMIADSAESFGLSMNRISEITASADLLVNISGHLTNGDLLARIRCKAYIDIDPGFTQFWHADPALPFKLFGHDFYFTIGENIGRAGCDIPTSGIVWQPVRQPVVLEDWPVVPSTGPVRFTTVGSWRGAFGAIEHAGRKYGLKVHEFRKFMPLPNRVAKHFGYAKSTPTFEIALDIHPGDAADLQALQANHWQITNPKSAAPDANAFRQYVQDSGAEFSVAQGIYADTASGWFSDRTVRYLASGKPALVQDTGFDKNILTGKGLIAFSSLDEAANGVKEITGNYAAHAVAARGIAEEYFDSGVVLSGLLDAAGMNS